MAKLGMDDVEFIVANTDFQALLLNPASKSIKLGSKTCRGLGARGNPIDGEKAAWESRNEIYRVLSGAEVIFLLAGLGGGTGTGAIPVFAQKNLRS